MSVPPRQTSLPSNGTSLSLIQRVKSAFAPGSTTSIPSYLANASLRIALTAFCLGTLTGIVLPRAVQILNVSSWYHQSKESSWLAWKANASSLVEQPWQRSQLHFYLLAWSLFHLLEFVITARYNQTRLYSDCECTAARIDRNKRATTYKPPSFYSFLDSERNYLPSSTPIRHL
jgi:protein-S-isoprenylcysteine O-methyltransferase